MYVDPVLQSVLDSSPESNPDGPRLRAYIACMLRGIEAGHTEVGPCRDRLGDALTRLARSASGDVTWERFYGCLMEAVDQAKDAGFYLRGPRPDVDLNLKAVTFQIADRGALDAWTNAPATPADLRKAVAHGKTRPGATVGLPGRAVWLTPYKGLTEQLLEEADRGASPDLAAAARSLIAQSGWKKGRIVVAFVTKAPLGELGFEALDVHGVAGVIPPVGSTILEAQRHKHFRHWPHVSVPPDTYGRTYHFDPRARSIATPPLSYGVPEVVRSPIPLKDMARCVIIGRLTADACRVEEPDDDFLAAVDAAHPLRDLFSRLLGRL